MWCISTITTWRRALATLVTVRVMSPGTICHLVLFADSLCIPGRDFKDLKTRTNHAHTCRFRGYSHKHDLVFGWLGLRQRDMCGEE